MFFQDVAEAERICAFDTGLIQTNLFLDAGHTEASLLLLLMEAVMSGFLTGTLFLHRSRWGHGHLACSFLHNIVLFEFKLILFIYLKDSLVVLLFYVA